MEKIVVDVKMVYEDGVGLPSMRRECPLPNGGKVEVAIRTWIKEGDYGGGVVEELRGLPTPDRERKDGQGWA